MIIQHILTSSLLDSIYGKNDSVTISFREGGLKVALQILGRKFYKDIKESSLYSQSLLICIHKTPIVKNHLATREITDLLRPR